MKYETLSEEKRREIAEEIEDSDWFFSRIYAELSIHIQQILNERGLLFLYGNEGFGADCVEVSDPILVKVLERYLNPPKTLELTEQ